MMMMRSSVSFLKTVCCLRASERGLCCLEISMNCGECASVALPCSARAWCQHRPPHKSRRDFRLYYQSRVNCIMQSLYVAFCRIVIASVVGLSVCQCSVERRHHTRFIRSSMQSFSLLLWQRFARVFIKRVDLCIYVLYSV